MSGSSHVNSQITDSVSQANSKVIGDAPAIPMSFQATSGEGEHRPARHPHHGVEEHNRGGHPPAAQAPATPGLQLAAEVDHIEAEADAGAELDP